MQIDAARIQADSVRLAARDAHTPLTGIIPQESNALLIVFSCALDSDPIAAVEVAICTNAPALARSGGERLLDSIPAKTDSCVRVSPNRRAVFDVLPSVSCSACSIARRSAAAWRLSH
jgi:hypothetical protein